MLAATLDEGGGGEDTAQQSLIRGICLQVRNLTLLAFYVAFHFMYRKGKPFYVSPI